MDGVKKKCPVSRILHVSSSIGPCSDSRRAWRRHMTLGDGKGNDPSGVFIVLNATTLSAELIRDVPPLKSVKQMQRHSFQPSLSLPP